MFKKKKDIECKLLDKQLPTISFHPSSVKVTRFHQVRQVSKPRLSLSIKILRQGRYQLVLQPSNQFKFNTKFRSSNSLSFRFMIFAVYNIKQIYQKFQRRNWRSVHETNPSQTTVKFEGGGGGATFRVHSRILFP